MTFRFDLDFKAPKKGDMPGPSVSQVYIKNEFSREDGFVSVTPVCMSYTELESEIEKLKIELDKILDKAKRRYKLR